MILPDVNVLIYAFHKDAPEHATCNPWPTAVVASDARFGLSRLALAALVRVTTNPRYHPGPSVRPKPSRSATISSPDPSCHVVGAGKRHWEFFAHLFARRYHR